MDRRYKEAKGASKTGVQQSEAITRNTTRRARVQGHAAKQYGGQPRGAQSIQGQASSKPILQNKNAEALERSKTFKSQQMGNQFDKKFKSDANPFKGS
jgi:hypothetical protein